MEVIDYEAAVSLMSKLAEECDDVSVFVDSGWGGREPDYFIIVDGDGQNPHAKITKETFDRLLLTKIIGGNNLVTYKARRNHPFQGEGTKLGNTLFRAAYPTPPLPGEVDI